MLARRAPGRILVKAEREMRKLFLEAREKGSLCYKFWQHYSLKKKWGENVSIELGDQTVYNFQREAVSKRTL